MAADTFNVPIVDASQYNKLGMDNLLYMKPFRGIIFNSLYSVKIKTYPKLEICQLFRFSEGWATRNHWAKNWIVHRSLSKN
jgi:hypothetical protein